MTEPAAGGRRRGGVPAVGIGLPVHNGAEYLARALTSLLAQDYEDFEITVHDNGSTDDTVAIARAVAREDPRVLVHVEPVNRGAAWNFNQAFHRSRGRYFTWAAHDDMYHPAFLGRCVEVLERQPDVVLAHARTVDIDEADAVVRQRADLGIARSGDTRRRLRSVLLVPTPCFEVFGVVRRDELARTGLIGAYAGSDRTLLLELAALGRFHLVDEPLFLHRQHPERSVHQNARAERTAWFDPGRRGRVVFPSWRMLAEFARVVHRTPMGSLDRVRAWGDLGVWMVDNRRHLVRHTLGGSRDAVLASLQRARGRHAVDPAA